MNLSLEGKTALVCGASSGLGLAVAKEFAQAGAKVAMASRNHERIIAAADEVAEKTDAEVLAVTADLSKNEDIQNLFKGTVTKFGGLDILFTNTGGPPPGFFDDFDDEAWVAAHEAQLLSVVRLIRLAVPEMKKRGGGRIINNTSISVREPIDNLLLSNVYRAGVAALSKSLSRQLAADGILVNCLAPGFTRTARLENLFKARAEKAGATIEDIESGTAEKIPLGRIPEASEFAKAALFLASDAASAINGIILPVDGGVLSGL